MELVLQYTVYLCTRWKHSNFHSSLRCIARGFRLACARTSWLALAMPAGTGPGRSLELVVVTMVGNTNVLSLSNSSTAAKLHHVVRKLTGIRGSIDLIHNKMGAVFGYQKDYGTREYDILQGKKLCNLRVRNGSVITIVKEPPSLDENGDEIPALVSSSESDAEPVS